MSDTNQSGKDTTKDGSNLLDSRVNAIVNEVNEVDEHDKPANNSEIQKKNDAADPLKADEKQDVDKADDTKADDAKADDAKADDAKADDAQADVGNADDAKSKEDGDSQAIDAEKDD